MATVVMDPDWERTINNEIRHEFRRVANEMEAVAVSLAAERTGELKHSIRAVVRQPSGTIFIELTASAAHAGFVEYGTGGRGRATQNIGIGASMGALRAFGKGTYTHGASKGMVAQPFLRPAVLSVIQRNWRLGGS